MLKKYIYHLHPVFSRLKPLQWVLHTESKLSLLQGPLSPMCPGLLSNSSQTLLLSHPMAPTSLQPHSPSSSGRFSFPQACPEALAFAVPSPRNALPCIFTQVEGVFLSCKPQLKRHLLRGPFPPQFPFSLISQNFKNLPDTILEQRRQGRERVPPAVLLWLLIFYWGYRAGGSQP